MPYSLTSSCLDETDRSAHTGSPTSFCIRCNFALLPIWDLDPGPGPMGPGSQAQGPALIALVVSTHKRSVQMQKKTPTPRQEPNYKTSPHPHDQAPTSRLLKKVGLQAQGPVYVALVAPNSKSTSQLPDKTPTCTQDPNSKTGPQLQEKTPTTRLIPNEQAT